MTADGEIHDFTALHRVFPHPWYSFVFPVYHVTTQHVKRRITFYVLGFSLFLQQIIPKNIQFTLKILDRGVKRV
jgi:hypothetical protein